MECMEAHYVKDCDHDFTGPMIESDDGLSASVVCSKCGMSAMSHDLIVGP